MRGAGLFWVSVLTLAALSAPAQAAPLPVNVGGRVAAAPGGGYEFGWPGVYFESRFKGPAVTVVLESATEHLAVTVDGAEKARLQEPGRVRLTLSDLGPGEHVIRVQKLTESQTGGARFLGFFPGKGTTALPPPRRARQVEFIGDSYTVGYGNTSRSRSCTRDEVHDTTNTALAFGPIVAGRLEADYQINAYSGAGVVRNYGGSNPDRSMLSLYARTIPGDAARAYRPPATWRPQLVVIGLGTNDFSTPVKAGERWADREALRADYRAKYAAFAREVLRRPSKPRLILLAAAEWAEDVRAVAGEIDPAGERVRVVVYEDLDLGGCDYHPSVADGRRIADLITGAVVAFGPIWPR